MTRRIFRSGWGRAHWRVALGLACALPLAGCLATQTDVKALQADIAVVRAESRRADSLRAAQLALAITALRGVADSLHGVQRGIGKLAGDNKGDFFAMQQQLIQIQELTGQSQRRLQEMRANLEERTAGGAIADTARGAAPGPNQLLQLSLDQLRRGSAGAARAGFGDLLARFPESEAAPLAQFYVGEAFAAEGDAAAADSVYLLVLRTTPKSPKAPTALYKHALVLLGRGDVAGGRAALADVVKLHPQSDEAVLAADRLRELK